MTQHAIEIRRVNKHFGATHAVRDLDLVVPTGSLCGFLGPNGAGKSTTIRMIMSIIYPDAGEIDVLGSSALSNKDRIGYLPEERGLYKKMRVGEFLLYMARLKGVRHADPKAHVRQWLERIELPEVERQRCQELSKGMQQKVQFVASVIHDPDLIILDEPFSGLDPVNADLLNRLIRELNAEGRTIIFSTHVLYQAEQLCDRIFLINKGEKLLDSTLEEIRQRWDPHTILVEPATADQPAPAAPDGVLEVLPRDDGHSGWELRMEEDANPQEIINATVNAMPVRSIALRQLSLEEVFIRIVSESAGADAAATAREELSHA